MSDDTDILSLPLILPAQAQKHVTHNEALAALDVIVQLAVIDRDRTLPPALPSRGDRHIVASGATQDWAAQDARIAVWTETGWQFHAALPGWRAQVLAEGETAVFDGLAWAVPSEGAGEFARLGVSATPDATNRLAVSSPATLLNHAGGGHQLKLNKAAAGDTASLLFQTGFSGRAEMGTAGSDAFQIKVSGDGATFHTTLAADGLTGEATLPAGAALPDGGPAQPALRFAQDGDTGLFRAGVDQIGLAAGGVLRARLSASALQLEVPLTGPAVTQAADDVTLGRLLKVGDFGLGGGLAAAAGTPLADVDATTVPAGFHQTLAGTTAGTFPAGENAAGQLIVLRHDLNGFTQIWMSSQSDSLYSRRYRLASGGFTPWRRLVASHNIVGTVGQSGGIPTGAVVERGANANGEFLRLADGTQTCWRTGLSAANVSTADGALFRSANVAWTFPAAFTGTPVVTGGQVADADCFVTPQVPGATSVNVRLRATLSKAGAVAFALTATGRWF